MSNGAGAFSFSQPPARLFAAWSRRNAIGIVSPSYGTEKISYGLAPAGYTFHKLFRLPIHRAERVGTFWHNTPLLMDHPVELVHTFNELPCGVRPFVVSFENELPRYLGAAKAWQLDFGFALLESPRCRKILALSGAAAAGLRAGLAARGLDAALNKVSVFRGSVLSTPQESRDGIRRSRNALDPLRVLFVGRDAFGKGLLPTLDALDACRTLGAEIEATVICDFETRRYISKGREIDALRLAERMRSTAHITYHRRLPNQEVHRLMHSHDVLVFPTLDESLGWVAVEAAMAGMPVVTTDIFAIPELVVEGKTGFLMPIAKNDLGRWVGLWLDGLAFDVEVARTFDLLRTGIARALMRFVECPSLVDSMGEAARTHMDALYGLPHAQRQLGDIYATALER